MKVNVINKSNFPLPKYETEGAAGMDVRANISEIIQIKSLERLAIPTGLYMEIPAGYEVQVRPRSGISFKKGISLPNAPGTIDSDYRGELTILIVNLSNEVQQIEPGERIAQMVIAKHEQINWCEVDELSDSARGTGRFGHTGTH